MQVITPISYDHGGNFREYALPLLRVKKMWDHQGGSDCNIASSEEEEALRVIRQHLQGKKMQVPVLLNEKEIKIRQKWDSRATF